MKITDTVEKLQSMMCESMNFLRALVIEELGKVEFN